MLSKRVNRIGLSTTLRISAAAKALAAEGVDVVDLSIGEPDFPTPEHIKRAAKAALDRNETGYTQSDGTPHLKRAIQEKFLRDNALRYDLDQILVSPGAKFSIYLAIAALVDSGQDVLIPAPYWVSYPEQVRLAGGNPVFVPTREADGFRLTPRGLRQALTFNSKLLILNYPSNPTGTSYSREQLAELAEICEQEGVFILADEIYEKLSYDGRQHVSIAGLSEETYKKTIVVNGVSKAFAMTGWRIGYAAGPRQILRAMSKIQSHATSNPTTISQTAAVEALSGPQGELSRMNAEFARRRNMLVYKLRSIDGISCDEPGGAFYLFPNVSRFYDRQYDGTTIRNSYGLSYYLLKHAHVAVVPGDAFGGPDHIRLSYASSMDRLKEGVSRLEEALSRLERPRRARAVSLDNVVTKVDSLLPCEVSSSRDELARLSQQANRAIGEDEYYEWNAAVGGIIIQLRSNSPHLYRFFQENWYPAPLETEFEPHAVIYGVKGLAGRPPGAVYFPGANTGFVVNTANYEQLRHLVLGIVADAVELRSGGHLVRAAALDIGGRGLLLMGGPGSGLSRQFFNLLRQENVKLVSSDTVVMRYSGNEALADLIERKLYLKTKWAALNNQLPTLFTRSPLENVVTWAHQNERCDGGETCAVTRGQGACYLASNSSRAMVDPYWFGGAKRHTKRSSVGAVAIFTREPLSGPAVRQLSLAEALAQLEHATLPGREGGTYGVPWFNDYLLDTTNQRYQAQRALFGKLLEVATPYRVNTAYEQESRLTADLRELVRKRNG